jgi:hypothetical protein
MRRKDVNAALLLVFMITVLGSLVTAIYWMIKSLKKTRLEVNQCFVVFLAKQLQVLKASSW